MTETTPKNAVNDRWIKEHLMRVHVKFNLSTEQDIVTALSECDNRQGFIKEAIRYYLANGCPDSECISESATLRARMLMEDK